MNSKLPMKMISENEKNGKEHEVNNIMKTYTIINMMTNSILRNMTKIMKNVIK